MDAEEEAAWILAQEEEDEALSHEEEEEPAGTSTNQKRARHEQANVVADPGLRRPIDEYATPEIRDKMRTGSNKKELNSKKKLEKKLSFYTKVKDTVTSLNAKKAISKKKKQRSRQKKLKAYDFSELSEFLPETASSQQPTEVKLNCKSKQALVQRESAQLNAVLNNPQFQLDPFAAIHQHLVLTQLPSSIKEDEPAKTGKKSRKDKKRKKKKNNNAMSTSQSMEI